MKQIFKSTFAILVLMMPCLYVESQEQLGSKVVSSRILSLHLDQVQKALDMHLYDDAWNILQIASEFQDDRNPMFFILKARILMYQGHFFQAKIVLEDLFMSGNLDAFSEMYLYEVYLRNRDYKSVKELFGRGLLRNSDAYFYYQLALLQTQDTHFSALSFEAKKRFHNDIRFYILNLVAVNGSWSDILKELELLSSIVRKDNDLLIDLSVTSQDIVLSLLRRLPENIQLAALTFLDPWLNKHINYHLMLRHNFYLNKTTNEQLLESLVTFSDPDWTNLVGNYLFVEYLQSLEDVAFVTSGLPWAEDIDFDGFPNLIGTVNALGDGYIVVLPSQDDFFSIKILYDQFMVTGLVEEDRNSIVDVSFSVFPQVSSIRVRPNFALTDSSSNILPEFLYHLRFSALSMADYFNDFSIGDSIIHYAIQSTSFPALLGKDLLPLTNYLDEIQDAHHIRRLRIVNGRVMHVWEDTQKLGYFDRFLSIKNGKIMYGRRTFMSQNDYLLLELYENDKIVGVAFSSNEGSGFDFYEETISNYKLQVWDFNENEYIDVYRKWLLPPSQPREQRVWFKPNMPINSIIENDFDEAKRWLGEVY